MTTQYVLRTDKKDSTGRCPVHLVICFNGVRHRFATGDKCRPGDWNVERQQFRRSFPVAEEANQSLLLRMHKVNTWWHSLRAVDEAPTVTGLRELLKPAPAVPAPVVELVSVAVPYEEYREALQARGYARESLRQHLEQFSS